MSIQDLVGAQGPGQIAAVVNYIGADHHGASQLGDQLGRQANGAAALNEHDLTRLDVCPRGDGMVGMPTGWATAASAKLTSSGTGVHPRACPITYSA